MTVAAALKLSCRSEPWLTPSGTKMFSVKRPVSCVFMLHSADAHPRKLQRTPRFINERSKPSYTFAWDLFCWRLPSCCYSALGQSGIATIVCLQGMCGVRRAHDAVARRTQNSCFAINFMHMLCQLTNTRSPGPPLTRPRRLQFRYITICRAAAMAWLAGLSL